MRCVSLRLATCAAVAAAQIGCTDDEFDPYGRLVSLRVLAIKTDPVAPAPGEATTLSSLLYVPKGQSKPKQTWSWCPFPESADNGFRCGVDEASLRKLAGPIDVPDYDLGSGDTAEFLNTLPVEALTALCQGVADAPEIPDCNGGFPVQIRLRVTTDRDEIIAVRTLRLGLDPDAPPNRNPEIDGVSAQIGKDWQQLGLDADVAVLPRDKETNLKAHVSQDQAEEYMDLDENGDPVTLTERLNIAWFVESGSTKSERTGFIDGVASMDILRENKWIPARTEDYARGKSELILVLHDNREGVNWLRVSAGLKDKP